MALPKEDLISLTRLSAPIDFSKHIDTTVLQGRVALITGGASGLGLAIAKAFVEAGVHVAIADLNNEAGKQVEKDLTATGHSIKFFQVDTTDFDSQASLFRDVLAWKEKQLDIVVPAAGVLCPNIRDLVTKDGAEPVRPPLGAISVNLIGVYYSAFLALFYFNERSKSMPGLPRQLLFISSLIGYAGAPTCADYVAGKYGVRGLWKAIRVWSRKIGGTQTNLLAPTFMHTPMVASSIPFLQANGVKVGQPSDVVSAVMTAVCDPDIDGRAICVLDGDGRPGSNNFDLEDDLEDGAGSTVLLAKVKEGVFGELFN